MMPNLLILARFSVEMDLSTAFLLYLAVTLGTLLSMGDTQCSPTRLSRGFA